MSATTLTSQKAILREMTDHPVRTFTDAVGLPIRTSEYFGVNTFGVRQMRDKLPPEVYTKIVAAGRHGKKLDLDVAPRVAQAIKEWFFFQAEDGIRDLTVTGVQTCALPI